MRDGGGGDEQGDAFCSSSETLRLDEVLYGNTKGFWIPGYTEGMV